MTQLSTTQMSMSTDAAKLLTVLVWKLERLGQEAVITRKDLDDMEQDEIASGNAALVLQRSTSEIKLLLAHDHKPVSGPV